MSEHYMYGPKIPLEPRYWTAAIADDSIGVDLDDAVVNDADIVATFNVPFKCAVSYAAIVLTETIASVTKAPCIKFTKRVTAGSDVGATAGDVATIYPTKTGTAGSFYYDKAAKASGLILYPGQEVAVEIDVCADSGTGGHFIPMLVVEPIPETMANLTSAIETA